MLSSLFPLLYGFVVIVLFWQACRVIWRGFLSAQDTGGNNFKNQKGEGDRTGRLTIHPELLDQEGRITDEELLTVRFSGDVDPPQSAETSAE